jgi:hypothetical protein
VNGGRSRGSFPRVQKLSDEEIVRRYLGGESQGILGLKAGIADARIKAVLLAAGVTLRSRSEYSRAGHAAGLRARERARRA